MIIRKIILFIYKKNIKIGYLKDFTLWGKNAPLLFQNRGNLPTTSWPEGCIWKK